MTKSLKRRHYAHMIGVDSGDLLVMGGHDTLIYAYSTAIYRLSSNVWNYVGEFRWPMVREADPLKIGNCLPFRKRRLHFDNRQSDSIFDTRCK